MVFKLFNHKCGNTALQNSLLSNIDFCITHPSWRLAHHCRSYLSDLWLETSLCCKYPIESRVCYVIKIRILAEAYLETNRRSTIDSFCGNSWWLKTANYFRKKTPSQMFGCVLNTLLTCTRDVDFLKKL